MKGILLLGFTLLILCGCEKPTPPAPIPTPAPTPVATPKPTPTPRPTPQARLAPEGEYYLVKRTSVTTDDGIVGVPIGSKVQLVSKDGNDFKVSYLEHTLTLPSEYLTRDLDFLDEIFKNLETQRKASQKRQIIEQLQPVEVITPEENARIVYEKQKELLSIQMDTLRKAQDDMRESLSRKGVNPENSPNYSLFKRKVKTLENQMFQLEQAYKKSRVLAN